MGVQPTSQKRTGDATMLKRLLPIAAVAGCLLLGSVEQGRHYRSVNTNGSSPSDHGAYLTNGARSNAKIQLVSYGTSRYVTRREMRGAYYRGGYYGSRPVTQAEVKAGSRAPVYKSRSVNSAELKAGKKPAYRSRPVNAGEVRAGKRLGY